MSGGQSHQPIPQVFSATYRSTGPRLFWSLLLSPCCWLRGILWVRIKPSISQKWPRMRQSASFAAAWILILSKAPLASPVKHASVLLYQPLYQKELHPPPLFCSLDTLTEYCAHSCTLGGLLQYWVVDPFSSATDKVYPEHDQSFHLSNFMPGSIEVRQRSL